MRLVGLLALGGVLVGVGCGSDGGEASPAAGGGAGGAAGGAAGAAGAAGGTAAITCERSGDLDLNGVWLVKAKLDVKMSSGADALVKVCPSEQRGPADLFLVLKIEQSGAELTSLSAIACDLTLPEATALVGACDPASTDKIKARVAASSELLQALPGIAIPPAKGKLGGTADGSSFEPDRFTYTLGSKSTSGPMASWKGGGACDDVKKPLGTGKGCEVDCVTSCDDVVDSDGDGYPGVSMTVCGLTPTEPSGAKCNTEDPSESGVTLQGKALLDFRVDPQLKGVAQSSCFIKGTVDAEIVYNVVGANVWLAGGILPVQSVIQAIPTFEVLPETSQFAARRIDGQYGSPKVDLTFTNPTAACQAAIANKNLL